jgi:hypothetical protein
VAQLNKAVIVGFEVLTVVVMKSSLFWNITRYTMDYMAFYPRR